MSILSRPIIGLRIGERLQSPEPPPFEPSQIQSVQSGATAEWWDTTIQASVLNASGSQISKDEVMGQILGQNNTANTNYTTADGDSGDGSGTTIPLSWGENNLYQNSEAGFWSAPLATDPANEGIGVFCSFIFEENVGADSFDIFWLQQQTGPWFGQNSKPEIFSDSGNNSVRFELTDDAGDNYTVQQALNDGIVHSVGYTYNLSDGLLRFFVDGQKVSEATPAGTVLSGNAANMSCGDRSSVHHDSFKALVVRGYVTEGEAGNLDDWLRRDCKQDGAAVVANNVSVSGDENTTISGTFDAVSINGTTISYSKETGPSNGTVSLSGESFDYEPDTNYSGSDSFDYRADNDAGFGTATVDITVNAVATVLFEDTFTESSSTDIADHALDTDVNGNGWTVDGDDGSTVDGTLSAVSNNGNSFIHVDCGAHPFSFQSTVVGSASNYILILRYQDQNNYLQVIIGSNLFLSEIVNGSGNAIENLPNNQNDGDVYWVTDDGTTIRIGKEGAGERINEAVSRFSSSQKIGYKTNTSTSEFDNFKAIDAADETQL